MNCASPKPGPKAGGKWLVYLAVSVCANLLIAHAVGVDGAGRAVADPPALKVNLMARASPALAPRAMAERIEHAVPSPRPEHATPPPSPEKVVTVEQAREKVAVRKPEPKAVPSAARSRPADSREAALPEQAPVAQKRELVAVAQPAAASSGYDNGRQVSTVIHKANYRRWKSPVYPRRALELGQEGMVTLHAEVSPDGFPRQLKVVESSGHSLLDMAALTAVKRWEFEPTSVHGDAVSSWVRVPVRFVIRD